tara:strand:- start:90 stop:308 length:219 start_codon:yes stop_codon:yes gene_type:complete
VVYCSPKEAEEIILGLAEHIEKMEELISDLDGHLIQCLETFDLKSFNREQLLLLRQWRVDVQQTKLTLRNNG